MVEDWHEVSDEEVGDFYIFRVHRVRRTSPRTGQTRNFVMLKAPDWINIIPVTRSGEVLFVHQYRHGTKRVTMEIPAGMMDPHESDPRATAERELLEETGFSAEKVVKLGMVEPNSAFLDNRCHTYLALGCTFTQEPELDGGEDIYVDSVPLTELDTLVTSGKILHGLTINAFYHFNRWKEENSAELARWLD